VINKFEGNFFVQKENKSFQREIKKIKISIFQKWILQKSLGKVPETKNFKTTFWLTQIKYFQTFLLSILKLTNPNIPFPMKAMLHFMNDNVPASSKNFDPNTPKKILARIRQTARDYRNNHLHKGVLPRLMCPGMLSHACNFIRYVDENRNHGDKFYKNFFVSYPDYEDDLKWSLVNVEVRKPPFFNKFSSS